MAAPPSLLRNRSARFKGEPSQEMAFENVSLAFEEKAVLEGVSFRFLMARQGDFRRGGLGEKHDLKLAWA